MPNRVDPLADAGGARRRNPQPERRRFWGDDPVVRRIGRVALIVWAVVGLLLLAYVLMSLTSAFRIVLVPMVLALFPTIVLAPVYRILHRAGLPPALASLLAVVGLLGALGVIGFTIGRAVHGQLDDLGVQLKRGYDQVREWLANDSPITVEIGPPTELADRLRAWVSDGDGLGVEPTTVLGTTFEIIAGTLLMFVATFFYLKDGRRLIQWLPDSLRAPWSRRVTEASELAWDKLSAYFRGQLIVALVDAIGIGVGLVVLGVPLALPLAILVFFGGFFPIVGATVTGMVAALVALADGGPGVALAVVAVVIVVQQVEGNVLEPYIVGRATRLHPLVVILVLTAAGAQAGLLGAFLGVPVAAVIAALIRYGIAERNGAGSDRAREAKDESPVVSGGDGVRAPSHPT